MKLLGTKQEIFQVRPNIVNYIEENEQGLHFHYSLNKPWTLYFGNAVLFRKEPQMSVIEQAWERDFDALLDLRIQLDRHMASGTNQSLKLEVNGVAVELLYVEVLFLRNEIESIVRELKFEMNKWELRPVGQRVPTEHEYAMN